MNKDKLKQKIAELQALLNEPEKVGFPLKNRVYHHLGELLQALLDEPEQDGFPLKDGGKYWWISGYGTVITNRWRGDADDLARLKMGNVFLTAEDAQAHADWLRNQHALMCEAAKNEGVWGVFWEEADYRTGMKTFEARWLPNIPTFASDNFAQAAYRKILGSEEAIKAHLTFKSKAVKYTEVV
jgi:hypothetical protein